MDTEQKVRRSELFGVSFLGFGDVRLFFCSLGSRDDVRDDIGVSVERLLDLNCNPAGRGQREREGDDAARDATQSDLQ